MHTSQDPLTPPGAVRRRVCLFGGTFDPVHHGHLAMAGAAQVRCNLDRLVFLPAQRSPHKLVVAPAPAADRLAMLRLAVRDLAWAEVSDWEVGRAGPSYSWQAVGHFSALFGGGVELCWLLGADQWAAVETWARPEVLAAGLVFIVFPRGESVVVPKPGFRHEFIDVRHPASSTSVRAAARMGGNLAGLVPPAVAEYIVRHRLYQPGGG